MGSSKKVTVGYRYFVGVHFQLCRALADYLYGIEVAERPVWQGSTPGGQITITAKDIFGGTKREGGVSGDVDIEMGAPDQAKNDYLASKIGSGVPAHRGIVGAVLRQVEVGMNPYLKSWRFTLQRIYKRGDGSEQWYPEKAGIFTFANDPGAQFVNIDARVHYANTFADGLTRGVTVSGFDPSDEFIVTMPPGRTYSAFSYIGEPNIDPLDPNSGSSHHFNVALDGDSGNVITVSSDLYDGYEAARRAFGGLYLTGASSYTFFITDSDSYSGTDNSGGLSLALGAPIGLDMNPAHIIREALTDAESGMGVPEAEIGASFTAAADTFFAEGLGLSILWEESEKVEDFIKKVQSHADAHVFVDRRTGKWEIKPVRDDYDPATLLVLDDSNIISWRGIERRDPADAVNTVTVDYFDRKLKRTASRTVHDLALIQETGGVRHENLKYEGAPNEAIGSRIAYRDLVTLSSPIATGAIDCTRAADALNPGDVFKLNSARHGFENEVCRVVEIEEPGGSDHAITIKFASDVFALGASPLVFAGANESRPTIEAPSAAAPRLVEEAPYWLLVQEYGHADTEAELAADPASGRLNVAAGSSIGAAFGAETWTSADGGAYEEKEPITFSPSATLAAAVTAAADETVISIADAQDVADVEIASIASIGGELVRVDAVSPTSITVGRGCLDTHPQAHAAGTPVIFWGVSREVLDAAFVAGESVDVKMLTTTGLGALALDAAPIDGVTLDSRAIRPLPAGNFRAASFYVPDPEFVTIDPEITLSWAHRDRLAQTSPVLDDHAAGDIGPEPGVSYVVEAFWADLDAGTIVEPAAVSRNVGTSTSDTVALVEMGSQPGETNGVALRVRATRDGYLDFSPRMIYVGATAEAGGGGDPLWESVVLLSHFTGANGSTTFSDESEKANTLTAIGNVQVQNDEALFDGSGDYIEALDQPYWHFDGDFTIELFGVKFDVNEGRIELISHYQASGNQKSWTLEFRGDATPDDLMLIYSTNGSAGLAGPAGAWTPTVGQAYDLCVDRSGSTARVYIDGAMVGSATISGALFNSSGKLKIGRGASNGPSDFDGTMKAARITKGAARYASDSGYTVPSLPLPNALSTSLSLYSFSAGSRTEHFVDQSNIAESSGVSFGVNRPTKYVSNPILEPAGANGATWDYDKYYVSALYEGGVYKVWYGNIDDNGAYAGSSYATSADGNAFAKPNLGAVTYDGNTNNNIFNAGYDPTIIKDGASYIIQIGADANGDSNNQALIYSSPTGYDDLTLQKTITRGTYSEFHGLVKRGDGRWISYYTYGHGSNSRSIGAYLSDTTDIAGGWADQGTILSSGGSSAQFYYFSATLIAGVLYGFAGRYNSGTGEISVDLYTSTDGINWTLGKIVWVDNGPDAYDAKMIFAKSLIDDGAEWRFYYGGSVGHHGQAAPRDSRLSYASLGAGRLGHVYGPGGTLVTTAFTPSADLTINAASSGGRLKVELLNPDDTVIPGFAKADCDNLDGDSSTKVVTWGGASIPTDQSLKIKFYLDA
jgi:hypothetical protein